VPERFSDCELRDDWFLRQDVNAWTSLSYVAATAVLLVLVARTRMPTTFGLLASMLALEGVGSLLYHGGDGDVAQLLHDIPLEGLLGFVAGWHAGRLVDAAARGAWLGTLLGIAAASAAWAVAPGTVTVVAACGIAVVAIGEVVSRRHACPPLWPLPLILLVAAAGAAWVAGTPGSPVCDARSWLQPHGLWHVLTAVAIVWWVSGAAATIPRAGASSR
jgi:hypothetical protein